MNHPIESGLLVWILFAHWVGDFVLQSDRMAKGKSSSNEILTEHVATYTLVILIASMNLWYALLNGVIHFGIDWLTSRATSNIWKQGRIHDFFVAVGFDQYLHALTLIATIGLLS